MNLSKAEIDKRIAALVKQADELRREKRKLYMREYMRTYMREYRGPVPPEGKRECHPNAPKRDRKAYMRWYRSRPEFKLKRKLKLAGIDPAAIAAEMSRLQEARA